MSKFLTGCFISWSEVLVCLLMCCFLQGVPRGPTADAERNRNSQTAALKFARSNPTTPLTIGTLTMQLSVRFLNKIEKVASEEYDRQEWFRCMVTGSCESRMDFAIGGTLDRTTIELAGQLMDDPERWHALGRPGQSWEAAALAFVQISAILCALEALAFLTWRRFPWLLWALVRNPSRELAQHILDAPGCMKDRWTQWFLSHYATVDALLTSGRAVLQALAHTLRFDITRVECRNAALRRLLRSLGSTHCPYIRNVSADFLLLRQRLLERMLQPNSKTKKNLAADESAHPRRVRRRGKFKGQPTGGGGPQRFIVRRCLEGHRFPNKEARIQALSRANQEFHRVKRQGGPEWHQAYSAGAAGTYSHSHGGAAFPSAAKRQCLRRSSGIVPDWVPSLATQSEPNQAQSMSLGRACQALVAVDVAEQRAAGEEDSGNT